MITRYEILGENIRMQATELVLSYMRSNSDSGEDSAGITQAEIFRVCGFDWGEQPNATSSYQQFWVVALLRDLELKGVVVRDEMTKRWHLRNK